MADQIVSDKEAEIVNTMISRARYKPLGRGPRMFDCYGLVIEVARQLDMKIPYDPLVATSDKATLAVLIKRAEEEGSWKECSPETGAVAVFGRVAAGRHVGVCLAGGVLDIDSNGIRHRTYSRIDECVGYYRWVH